MSDDGLVDSEEENDKKISIKRSRTGSDFERGEERRKSNKIIRRNQVFACRTSGLGNEREAVLSLMNKLLHLKRTIKPKLAVTSVFTNGSKGVVYLESRNEVDAKLLVAGMKFLKANTFALVPVGFIFGKQMDDESIQSDAEESTSSRKNEVVSLPCRAPLKLIEEGSDDDGLVDSEDEEQQEETFGRSNTPYKSTSNSKQREVYRKTDDDDGDSDEDGDALLTYSPWGGGSQLSSPSRPDVSSTASAAAAAGRSVDFSMAAAAAVTAATVVDYHAGDVVEYLFDDGGGEEEWQAFKVKKVKKAEGGDPYLGQIPSTVPSTAKAVPQTVPKYGPSTVQVRSKYGPSTEMTVPKPYKAVQNRTKPYN